MKHVSEQFRQLKGGLFMTRTGRLRFASKFWRRAYRSTDGRTSLRGAVDPSTGKRGFVREISWTRRFEDRWSRNRAAKAGRRDRRTFDIVDGEPVAVAKRHR